MVTRTFAKYYDTLPTSAQQRLLVLFTQQRHIPTVFRILKDPSTDSRLRLPSLAMTEIEPKKVDYVIRTMP